MIMGRKGVTPSMTRPVRTCMAGCFLEMLRGLLLDRPTPGAAQANKIKRTLVHIQLFLGLQHSSSLRWLLKRVTERGTSVPELQACC